jgi:hypothetical protein
MKNGPGIKGADKLTAKEREFVRHVGEGKTLVDAYHIAYKVPEGAARRQNHAGIVAKRPAVMAAIDEFRRTVAANLVHVAIRYAVSRETISAELALIAFSKGRLTIDVGWTEDVKVPVSQIRRSLMDLATLHGYIVERRDVRVIRDMGDLTDDELAALVKGEMEHGTRH